MCASKNLGLRADLPSCTDTRNEFGIAGFAADAIESIEVILRIRLNSHPWGDGDALIDNETILTIEREAVGA